MNTLKLVTVRYPIASYNDNPDDVACSTVRDTPRVSCASRITCRMMASANPSRRCCGSVATEYRPMTSPVITAAAVVTARPFE